MAMQSVEICWIKCNQTDDERKSLWLKLENTVLMELSF